MKEVINKWEVATNNLADAFVKYYFGKNYEMSWVNNEVGCVLNINDFFFNIDTIIDFMKYRYSKKMMFEYYDYTIECHEKTRIPLNIKHYRQLKK